MKALRSLPPTFFAAVAWMRLHGYHLLFTATLVSMISLAAWWTVFIYSAVRLEYALRNEILSLKAANAAVQLGSAAAAPRPGPLPGEPAIEVVEADLLPAEPSAIRLGPSWSRWAIRPRPAEREEIRQRFRRRTIMVVGEGTLLAILLITSCGMLYYLIYIEKRAAAEKREFWSRATHEIKTPITGLLAFLETLKRQELRREELLPMVELALRQVERQRHLAENLLTGQRLERGKSSTKEIKLILKPYLADFIRGHGVNFSRGAVLLDADFPEETAVQADPSALHVILDNLLDNAQKYAGEKMKLKISVRPEKEFCEIAFSDNGPGFDPAMAEAVFEAHRRLSGELPGTQHGTGMGLFISRALARNMGGDLRAESAGHGRGATFRLRLKTDEKMT